MFPPLFKQTSFIASKCQKSGIPEQQVKRKNKIKSSAGCQENLQHCLGVHEEVTQTPDGVRDFWKVIKDFFFSGIPHQKAVLGDKLATHHEDHAKETHHPYKKI